MFKSLSRVTNNPYPPTDETQRLQSPRRISSGSGVRFIEAVKRIGHFASRLFAASTHEAHGAERGTERGTARGTASSDTPSRQHSMRAVLFNSSTAATQRAVFPFQVHHKFSAGVSGTNQAPSVQALLPQLADSLSKKQGFVYIRDDSGNSPLANFVESMRDSSSVSVGNNCSIIGAYQTPAETASVFSQQWTFQIYDANMEVTFEVPITEVPLSTLHQPDKRTDHLLLLKRCMDSHLQAIPNEYKDSPTCPTIICPQVPRVAQLLTAQEECLGRQSRGDLNCKQGVDWIYAAEETLQTISPETPRFVGEESCDFESFFTRTGVGELADLQVPISIGLAGAHSNDARYIRAFKRHLPQAQAEKATPATVPAATETTQPASNWLSQRNQGLAFKEPQLQMQCASQAVNSLLQRHEVDPEDVAAFIVNQKLRMLEQLDIDPSSQAGLMHPTIVQAIAQGQSVSISKAEFLGSTPGETCIATELTPNQGWRQLINIGAVERNQNWVNHATELASINQITINPEDWLSVQRGTEMRDLLELVNTTLASSRQAHQPRSMTHLNVREQPETFAQQEQRSQQFIARGKDFPIIVRTGQQSGHYFTIVPDEHGNWLGLNALGTNHRGVQPCDLFCQAGELAQTLQRLNVTDILVPTPQLRSRK